MVTRQYVEEREDSATLRALTVFALAGQMNRGSELLQQEADLQHMEKLETVSVEELPYPYMLTMNALVELLPEKGVLNKQEVLVRVKSLQAEMASKQKAH